LAPRGREGGRERERSSVREDGKGEGERGSGREKERARRREELGFFMRVPSLLLPPPSSLVHPAPYTPLPTPYIFLLPPPSPYALITP
jgi:hypothetical protein